ncbi:MAG: hypothetical protein O2816_11925 [Planctomycetota bacterium]|nr:hypothetical protein [Planctomycetota bacterium]
MAFTYVCTACNIKTTFQDAYGDHNCSECGGHMAYSVDMGFEPAPRGQVHLEAVAEISGNDKVLAGAVRMVFNRTAKGRSAPGTTNVNHIHVGGNAQLNLLFDSISYTVLGLVNGHMDSKMKTSIRNEADKVAQRFGGQTKTMLIDGDTIQSA